MFFTRRGCRRSNACFYGARPAMACRVRAARRGWPSTRFRSPPCVSPAPIEHTLSLWLPSSDAAPFASPELLATGAQEAPAGQPHLSAWRVTGVLLMPGQALDLLLASPSGLYGA